MKFTTITISRGKSFMVMCLIMSFGKVLLPCGPISVRLSGGVWVISVSLLEASTMNWVNSRYGPLFMGQVASCRGHRRRERRNGIRNYGSASA